MVRMRFCPKNKLWGMVLMIAGLVLMMIIVPCWAWAGIVCAIMVIAGFAIWRHC